ncbi:MAG TPA: hypothetical protein VFU36_11075 [Jatrophihabitans sp.]|nr:hypothetical protein [Jatrophihabitans sp.]
MKSGRYADEVMTELGEKVPYGIAQAVTATKADFSEYRAAFPAWVAEASERGLANWIHDRLWAHLVKQLDGNDDVNFSDEGPMRQFRVGTRYLFRAKRHSMTDKISSYPTLTATSFWSQHVGSLFPDMDEVRLSVGYRWDPEIREMEDAVISLRDAMDLPVWVVTVRVAPVTGAVELRPVTEDAPELPIIELISDEDEEDFGDEMGSE